MSTAYVIAACVTITANLAIAAADFAKAEFVVANSAEVGVPLSWLPTLATLKAAGAAGLLLGLLGIPLVGTAATLGLIAFYVGAVAAHVRAGVLYNIAAPLFFLALPTATLLLSFG
ncbi:DoxX family protein [Allokutzneria sp. A3M-2-11 16]|uniref:DoxX family protein n=1 Tax=Allokutzneria sp. A3M-2-11 16 TaxID=2962043 RepID=UPI0020B8E8EA|nr:DoxX family protein [Allokutzneria sp. A3M-2-11 16]MCP3804348.1 DoxX family protein [Allokutzneria sp. A3M-2-11 16]